MLNNLDNIYMAHPFWVWLAFGAFFLILEMPTASGYLLWPAASAAAVGVLTLWLAIEPPFQLIAFAILTVASTLIGRRLTPRRGPSEGPDISNRGSGLAGRFGKTTAPFAAGQGRVFVDGCEWTAELEPGQTPPEPGTRVEVVAVHGGGRLVVRGA
ncbi:MAG TPA: NfeD family protein [Caulobacteraceae bacterium]|jgi:membrane protein implicated in regulation of membrane protease activity|nr:NfeD family protein [Caulobacteraceae bacterium]